MEEQAIRSGVSRRIGDRRTNVRVRGEGPGLTVHVTFTVARLDRSETAGCGAFIPDGSTGSSMQKTRAERQGIPRAAALSRPKQIPGRDNTCMPFSNRREPLHCRANPSDSHPMRFAGFIRTYALLSVFCLEYGGRCVRLALRPKTSGMDQAFCFGMPDPKTR